MRGIKSFRQSFYYALRGLKYALGHERNFQIEVIMATVVIFFVFFFELKRWESIVVILMITWVMIMELTNTVMERIVDILKPRIHPYARLIKDIMAAVVLLSAVAALVIGFIIFLPYLADSCGPTCAALFEIQH